MFCMYIIVLLKLSQLISYSVIWKVLPCDFLAHNYFLMVDLILILNFYFILIIVFSTLNFMYLLLSVCWMLTTFCILLMDVLNAE
jgi:hypothetical protein